MKRFAICLFLLLAVPFSTADAADARSAAQGLAKKFPRGFDPRKEALREAGRIAVDVVLEQFKQNTEEIRIAGENLKVPETAFFVSSDLRISDVPDEVAGYIQARREAIRAVILSLAADVEASEKGNVKVVDRRFRLAAGAVEKIHETNVGIRGLKVAASMMTEASDSLYQDALTAFEISKKKTTSKALSNEAKDDLSRTYIEYNSFVYEISDLALELINTASVDARPELERIYQVALNDLEAAKSRIDARRQAGETAFDGGGISSAQRANDEALFQANTKAIAQLRSSWDPYFKIIDEQENAISELKERSVAISLQREQASIQLELLRLTVETGTIQRYFEDVGDVVDLVLDIPLLPVTNDLTEVLTRFDHSSRRNSEE